MEIRTLRALRGPNLWANFPVLEAWVDLQELDEVYSDQIAGFNDRLMGWLPTMIEHRCGLGYRGGFFERLRTGTLQGHILEHVTIELQCLAGTEVGFGKARKVPGQPGVYRVVIEYEEEDLGRACLEAAWRMLEAAREDKPFDVDAEVARLRDLAVAVRPDPGTRAIVAAAEARKIPVRRLDPRGRLLQLGQGAKARRAGNAQTDRTGAIAAGIAKEKELARGLLRSAGVPVPDEDGADRGQPHRLLVVDGRMVAAYRGTPDHAIDVTDEVDPEVAARAVEAARVVGLDIAGIDVVAADISRPLEGQGGVVVEVHAAPELRGHVEPVEGIPRPVGEAIVGLMFAPGEDGRIPTVAVTGTNGKTTAARLVAHLVADGGRTRVGLTCTDGVYIGDRRLEAGDCSGPKSARAVLANPATEAAVLETARGGVLREGLGFDRCDVAVVTNIAEGDHLGIGGIETPEQMALVKRTIVDVVRPTGAAVLNAADPLTVAMAEHCPGDVIFFGRDPSSPVVAAHLSAGKRVVLAEGGMIVLAQGEHRETVVRLEDVPLTFGGRVGFQVENALAATAAAWALGLPTDQMRRGLMTFASDPDRVPGRFNVLRSAGATVLMDFGHNPPALEALAEALAMFPHRHRSVVFSADGDRKDDVIRRQADILARAFDRVYLYDEPSRRRGRPEGQIPELLRPVFAASPRVSEIRELPGERDAIERSLADLQPGDLLVILHDAVEESLAFVRHCLANHCDDPAAVESGTWVTAEDLALSGFGAAAR